MALVNKPLEEASQDLANDFIALREDISKLSNAIADLLRTQASTTTEHMLDAVDSAKQKLSDKTSDARLKLAGTAKDAQERFQGLGADLGATIERNPLTAIGLSVLAGVVIGFMSRSQK
jgi:ElaB/YqjD/DUF883 family membrane-anchored ribosome-binding protein